MITLTHDECSHGLIELYKSVARKMGYDPESVEFDCTKIDVSEPVFDAFEQHIIAQGGSRVDVGMIWCFAGPKATIDSDEYLAEPHEGFIVIA